MGNAQKIPRKNQEENLDSIMAWTTQKKKKIFKEASPSISNAATSLKTMEAVLLNQYHERHDVVIVRLQ